MIVVLIQMLIALIMAITCTDLCRSRFEIVRVVRFSYL